MWFIFNSDQAFCNLTAPVAEVGIADSEVKYKYFKSVKILLKPEFK